jgi:sarcosine oxidase subunit beta
MQKENFDIVIVGGGIVGTATAYFLAKKGRKVCVVEKGVPGKESSGRNGGVIKPSHQFDTQLPVAARSTELWRMIDAESDLDFEYREQGYIRLHYTEADLKEMTRRVERDRAYGVKVDYLTKEETREMVPFMTTDYLCSTYCPSGGSAEPYLASAAMCRLAKRYGATVYENREVTGIEVVNDKVSAVLTTRGPISSGVIVIAANAWAREIGRMAGLNLPIKVMRSHVLVLERLPPFIAPVVVTGLYDYFRQTVSGNVVWGFLSKPQEGFDRRVTHEAIDTTARYIASLVPRLRTASLLRVHTGFTAWTPDKISMVGPVTRIKGLYLAVGLCGLGFQIGPTIGEQVSELVLNGRTTIPMEGYLPERFEIYQN